MKVTTLPPVALCGPPIAVSKECEALRKDAERYRMLRDNGYLDRLVGELHPCDEPRRTELTDRKVDEFATLHTASIALGTTKN